MAREAGDRSVTVRGSRWEWRQSWFLVFFLAYYLYWVPLVYMGVRVRRPGWAIWGGVYALPLFFGWFTRDEWLAYWIGNWTFLAFAAAAIHTWMVREDFIADLDVLLSARDQTLDEPGTAQQSASSLGEALADGIRDLLAPETDRDPTELNPEERRAAPAHAVRRVLDLNALTEAQFAMLPGLGPETAKHAVALRSQLRRFESFAQFRERLGLDAERAAKLEPMFVRDGEADTPIEAFTTRAPSEASPPPVHNGVVGREVDAASTVDLNAANAEAIADLPGVGEALARKAVDLRVAHGPFVSLENFAARVGLPASALEALRARTTVTLLAEPRSERPGRIVDV